MRETQISDGTAFLSRAVGAGFYRVVKFTPRCNRLCVDYAICSTDVLDTSYGLREYSQTCTFFCAHRHRPPQLEHLGLRRVIFLITLTHVGTAIEVDHVRYIHVQAYVLFAVLQRTLTAGLDTLSGDSYHPPLGTIHYHPLVWAQPPFILPQQI